MVEAENRPIVQLNGISKNYKSQASFFKVDRKCHCVEKYIPGDIQR